MGQIRQKTTLVARQSAVGQTHSRSHIRVRDVYNIIDEPLERAGTNLGLSPTETMLSALIGCTNVISKKIAKKIGDLWRDEDRYVLQIQPTWHDADGRS